MLKVYEVSWKLVSGGMNCTGSGGQMQHTYLIWSLGENEKR